jgi:AraC-like DNA-binding protein
VDGVFYDAGPGDMIVTGPRVTHQFQLIDIPMKFVIFQLSPRNLQNFQVSPHAAKTFITRREIEESPELCRRIDTIFEWLIDDPASTPENSVPAQQALCVHLHCLLARNFPSPEPVYADEAELAEFHEIFRYVNEHFREGITVSSIAKSLYSSRNKLPALFMKYTGTSLSDYIRELRIENAKQLLAAGSSITHAALESGFQNIRTFNSNFRCQMKMSPSEYAMLAKNEHRNIP